MLNTRKKHKKNAGNAPAVGAVAINAPFTQQGVNPVSKDTLPLVQRTHAGDSLISSGLTGLYNSLSQAYSSVSIDINKFKQCIWPVVTSGAALLIGDFVLSSVSQYFMTDPEYDFIYKLIMGATILGYSALHRITEHKYNSKKQLNAAIASEALAITYMYSSVFNGTQMLLEDRLSENYTLITSLGTSVLLVPGGIAYLVQKLQELLVLYEYSKGAQRSDTAAISSGRTFVANNYFSINKVLSKELRISSRIFQLLLIGFNIQKGDNYLTQFRNLPALLADLIPYMWKYHQEQHKKLEQDFEYNNQLHQVLRFTSQGAQFVSVKRYQLRQGDLVLCDASLDLSSVQISGELIALKRNEEGVFLNIPEQRKFTVNLQAQNGEDIDIEHLSKATFSSDYTQVELHAIHEGKQPGVLVGDKLNLFGHDSFFIQVMPEKELLLSSGYEKKSVIEQIISDRKQKTVFLSILASIITAILLKRDITLIPAEAIRLMFTVFQTMIPFSESFLRGTINNELMKELNQNLGDHPFETLDALRIVDFRNALTGYYDDRFPNGVSIVSDKTGTLTTNRMDILGIWNEKMPANVQQLLRETSVSLLPDEQSFLESFQVFISAYTNNTKELEPEEYAILQFYKSLLDKEKCLQVTTLGNNHLKKTISLAGGEKIIETRHLGLYRSLGGRLTLVDEGKNKYFVFCGVPKQDKFQETPLLHTYSTMQRRKGVLSRDWCIAQTPILENDFHVLKELFSVNDKERIEHFVLSHVELLKNMRHYATFLIDNPVKKGAREFIAQCRKLHVPVYVATGDTENAAANIVRVLYPENTKKIITIRADKIDATSIEPLDEIEIPYDSTIIFVGINPEVLSCLKKMWSRSKNNQPAVIFAEMSTEGKGILTRFVRDNKSFVVANGDGQNDQEMMKDSDLVIAHSSEEGTFAPGIKLLSNLSEDQARRALRSNRSIYELLDLNCFDSEFFSIFERLRNSQEMSSYTSAMKSVKATMDLAKGVGAEGVTDMYQQHWFSVGFDLSWLGLSFYGIKKNSDRPMSSQNIGASNLINKTIGIALIFAIFQALANYLLFDESTNFISMFIMLTVFSLILRVGLSIFKTEQEASTIILEGDECEELQIKTQNKNSVFDYLGTLFRPAQVNRVSAQSLSGTPELSLSEL